MGSKSDLPVMQGAADMLAHFDIPFEMTVVSAHRTPERMMEYAASAREQGLRVVVAGAGGAASLTMASVLLMVFILPWLGVVFGVVTVVATVVVPYLRQRRTRNGGVAVGDLSVAGTTHVLAAPVGHTVAAIARRPRPLPAASTALPSSRSPSSSAR